MWTAYPRLTVRLLHLKWNSFYKSFGNICYTAFVIGWLLIYKVPSEPSTARVTIWRRMKTLGAIYLQQSVCFLTDSEAHRTALQVAVNEVRGFGGEAHLLRIEDEDSVGGVSLTDAIRQARAAEYAELHEQIDLLTGELERETRAGKFTFAELEDTESGLERLRDWLARIRERDLPGGEGYRTAAGAMAGLTERVGTFTATVYRREAGAVPDTAGVIPEED